MTTTPIQTTIRVSCMQHPAVEIVVCNPYWGSEIRCGVCDGILHSAVGGNVPYFTTMPLTAMSCAPTYWAAAAGTAVMPLMSAEPVQTMFTWPVIPKEEK